MDEQTIAFLIWLQDYWNEDGEDLSDMKPEIVKGFHDRWVNHWLPALNEPHKGDCTKFPGPCTRCHVEHILATAKKFASAIAG